MLSDEDRKKLGFLSHVVDQGKDISKEEVRWLIDQLRTNLSHPDEFNFPDYVALLNRKKDLAYAVRRFLKPDWKASCGVAENSLQNGIETFFHKADCGVNNAFMVVRPWVRVHANTPEDLFEQLRRCTIQCKFDDDALVDWAPIDDFLIAPDGGGIRGWSPIIDGMGFKHVYIACELDQKEMNAQPWKKLGIFVPNHTIVRIEIKGPKDLKHPAIELITGFTAMEYTTEPEEKSEKYVQPAETISSR